MMYVALDLIILSGGLALLRFGGEKVGSRLPFLSWGKPCPEQACSYLCFNKFPQFVPNLLSSLSFIFSHNFMLALYATNVLSIEMLMLLH